MSANQVLLVIAPERFSDEQYFSLLTSFQDAGLPVTTISTRAGEIKGEERLAVADRAFQMVDLQEAAALIAVGGEGAVPLREDVKLQELLKTAGSQEKLIAGVGQGVGLLAAAGLLLEKQATSDPDEELMELVKGNGAHYTGLALTIDGNLLTAQTEGMKELIQEMISTLKEAVHAQR